MRENFCKSTLIATTLVFCFAVVAHAQPHEAKTSSSTVELGNARISIPAPEGFEEATSQFQRVKDRVVTTEAPENEVLLSHLTASDCELLRKGSDPTWDFYTKVSVLRAGRTVAMSDAMMATAVSQFQKEAEAFLNGPKIEELERHLEKGLSNLDSRDTKIDFSKPQIFGAFDNRPHIFSVLMLLTFKISSGEAESTIPALVSLSYVHVKERIIFVYVFRKFRSKADQETIKAFTTKWTSSILAAN